MTNSTPGRGHGARRVLALALGGARIAAAIGVAPAAAAPTRAPTHGVTGPASAPVTHNTATMTGSDLGGEEYEFGTIRLNTYWNTQKTQWTKQTLRFAMYDLRESSLHYARIFQGTCADIPQYLIKIRVRTDAAGRITSTATLTSAQRAIMAHLSHEYPAVSITVQDAEGSTGGALPCGQIWDEG
jgi:hypothetical protein